MGQGRIQGLLCGFALCAGVLFAAPTTLLAQSVAETEARLQAQLAEVLRQIEQQQAELAVEQKKGVSLERDINILNAEINEANLKIKAKNLAIASLGKDISKQTQVISALTGKIQEGHQSLSQLIREQNEIETTAPVDLLFSGSTLSDFLLDLDEQISLNSAIQDAVAGIKRNKSTAEVARQNLAQKQAQETNAKISIEEEQAKIQRNQKQKASLLSLSKAQQKSYQGLIAQQQAKAAAIRSALFSLRDTSAIQFGTALDYAVQISKVTGVRPAFLLAILTQESNLGKNVGSCYVTDFTTGDGVKVSTGAFVKGVMKPSRDVQPFLTITASVGRNPKETRVSCPIGGVGYGGAMGPAQFIPSTWKLFESKIKTALNISAPDPWNPRDAFTASALYLADLGAATGSAADEKNAACRYYSGRSCDNKSPANAFYGSQVMSKAVDIQVNMIDPLGL